MSHEAIELLSHVCFGSNHDRFLVQAVGIETFRLGEQCGHLVRKSRANSLWAAPWSALCAFDQGRYLVKPCSQYAAERRALATASLGERADRVGSAGDHGGFRCTPLVLVLLGFGDLDHALKPQ